MVRLASNVEKNSSLISGRKNCRISSPVVLTCMGTTCWITIDQTLKFRGECLYLNLYMLGIDGPISNLCKPTPSSVIRYDYSSCIDLSMPWVFKWNFD